MDTESNSPHKFSFTNCYSDIWQNYLYTTLSEDCLDDKHVFHKNNDKLGLLYNLTEI